MCGVQYLCLHRRIAATDRASSLLQWSNVPEPVYENIASLAFTSCQHTRAVVRAPSCGCDKRVCDYDDVRHCRSCESCCVLRHATDESPHLYDAELFPSCAPQKASKNNISCDCNQVLQVHFKNRSQSYRNSDTPVNAYRFSPCFDVQHVDTFNQQTPVNPAPSSAPVIACNCRAKTAKPRTMCAASNRYSSESCQHIAPSQLPNAALESRSQVPFQLPYDTRIGYDQTILSRDVFANDTQCVTPGEADSPPSYDAALAMRTPHSQVLLSPACVIKPLPSRDGLQGGASPSSVFRVQSCTCRAALASADTEATCRWRNDATLQNRLHSHDDAPLLQMMETTL